MIIKKGKWLVYSVLLVSFLGYGQTVNTGVLYIESGTKMSTIQEFDNKVSGDLVNDGDLFLYSHYNNDGLVTFSEDKVTGITHMNGNTGYQDISGSMPMQWYSAEFNNSKEQPAFHLSNELSVSGKVNFNKGIVDNDTYGGVMVFENSSTYSNAGDDSHVDGLVRKNGNQGFTFPIGDKTKYRLSGISAPESATDVFAGKYFFENADTSFPLANRDKSIVSINNQEYWAVDKVVGTSDVVVTLSWDDVTTPANITVNPLSAIHVVRWDAVKNLWIDEGGVVDIASKTVSTPVKVSGYSVFTTARVEDAVASDLVIYNGISRNGDGLNDYFRIEGLEGTENTVEIFNRWGVKVFGTTGYDTNGNVFRGVSEGRVTLNKNDKLPVGTYFYVVTFSKSDGNVGKKVGYLYIND